MADWKDEAGFTDKADRRALDDALDKMVQAVELVGDPAHAQAVLAEALFRVFELPKRSPAYQRKYRASQDRP